MNFGTALQHIRIGAKLRRKNWAGMLIYLVPASEFPYELARGPVKELFEPGDTIKYRAHIDYLAFDGSIGVYDFKQEDVLADDWEFVEGQVLYNDVDPADFEEVEDQFATVGTKSYAEVEDEQEADRQRAEREADDDANGITFRT